MKEVPRLKTKIKELENTLEQIELLSDWGLWNDRTNKDKEEILKEVNSTAKTALIKKTTEKKEKGKIVDKFSN